MLQNKERDPYFDNLKGILICLVCAGHCFNLYKDVNVYCNYMFHLIYAFHMPLFFYISGYFSKNVEKTFKRAFEALIIPAIPFELLYYLLHVLTGAENTEPFLTPIFAYWFCFVLFYCRALLPYLIKLKGVIIITFTLALAAGFCPNINEYMSLSRFMCLLPFFMLGYYTTADRMDKIRNSNALAVAVAGIIAAVAIFGLLKYTDYNLGFTLRSPYDDYRGVLFRSFQFLAAVPLSMAVMKLTPTGKSYLTMIGQRTLQIYFLHFYFTTAIKMFNPLPEASLLNAIIMLVLAPVIAIILATNPVSKCYDKLTESMNKLLIKDTL